MQETNGINIVRLTTAFLGLFLCSYVFLSWKSCSTVTNGSKTAGEGLRDARRKASCGVQEEGWVDVKVVSKTSDGGLLDASDASGDDFYTSTWPPLKEALCGEGAPNLHMAPMLFKLARDEVFFTDQATDYAPTRPLESMNTTELERSIEEKRVTPTAKYFFGGNWGISVLNGNYTRKDSGDFSLFKTRYVRMWKGGNNQIRALEEDLAEELGITDYESEMHMKEAHFETQDGVEPCIYTAVRDPISHFMSGYNEIEFRTFRTHTWPEARYHFDHPLDKNDHNATKDRFRGFVEDLLVEDGSFLVNSVYSHPFAMSRVLVSLGQEGYRLHGYLPDLTDLSNRWPQFLVDTCPGLPPLEAFPKPKVEGQHKSSSDPLGTYAASKEVWADGGPTARAMCLLSAPDYACYEDLPDGIPEFCQTVYTDHAQALTEYGRKHYMKYERLH